GTVGNYPYNYAPRRTYRTSDRLMSVIACRGALRQALTLRHLGILLFILPQNIRQFGRRPGRAEQIALNLGAAFGPRNRQLLRGFDTMVATQPPPFMGWSITRRKRP